jgi:hypothetical protein
LALAALATTAPAIRKRPQFRLRELLMLTTAVAVLLAMGPLGYFALAVFGMGALVLVGALAIRGGQQPRLRDDVSLANEKR